MDNCATTTTTSTSSSTPVRNTNKKSLINTPIIIQIDKSTYKGEFNNKAILEIKENEIIIEIDPTKNINKITYSDEIDKYLFNKYQKQINVTITDDIINFKFEQFTNEVKFTVIITDSPTDIDIEDLLKEILNDLDSNISINEKKNLIWLYLLIPIVIAIIIYFVFFVLD